jgi:hypothetical protein
MDPASRTDSSLPHPSSHSSNFDSANFFGPIIALITLALPLAAIAHFSTPPEVDSFPTPPYSLIQTPK